MSDLKEKFAAIKKLVFGESPAATTQTAGTEYKLQDGTAVTIDKLEVGGKVMCGDTACADGAYTLEDGTKFTVAAGLITEITPASAAPAEPLPEDMAKSPQKMQAAINKFAEDAAAGNAPDMGKMAVVLKACFEYCFGWQLREEAEKAIRQAAIETYKTGFAKLEKQLADQKKANELLLEVVEQFSEKSQVPPAELPANFDELSPLEKRRLIRAQEAKK